MSEVKEMKETRWMEEWHFWYQERPKNGRMCKIGLGDWRTDRKDGEDGGRVIGYQYFDEDAEDEGEKIWKYVRNEDCDECGGCDEYFEKKIGKEKVEDMSGYERIKYEDWDIVEMRPVNMDKRMKERFMWKYVEEKGGVDEKEDGKEVKEKLGRWTDGRERMSKWKKYSEEQPKKEIGRYWLANKYIDSDCVKVELVEWNWDCINNLWGFYTLEEVPGIKLLECNAKGERVREFWWTEADIPEFDYDKWMKMKER